MQILFIHQNFPGQFKHLAPALVRAGHGCTALTLRVRAPGLWQGVRLLPYRVGRGSAPGVHPWVMDLETKVIRGEACFRAAMALRDQGYRPDLIIAHPGWGESMFLRDVWPAARIGLYQELYHLSDPAHVAFDPEFRDGAPGDDALRIRLRNLNNRLHQDVGDLGISPTRFQADTFPQPWRDRIEVIHDGIDTARMRPDPAARLVLADGTELSRDDEVVSFVNRNLEPYRGYHVFMRALPDLLRARPRARVVIVGGDGTSYGARPPEGTSWKQIYLDEQRPRIPAADLARVHFTGRLSYEHFRRLMQITRAHVYLTYPFVLSWSLLEAMSAGAPVVASDTAPVREVVRDGEGGLLVDFFDAAALAATVARLLGDDDLRAGLSRRARQVVIDGYDLHSHCLPRQMAWIDRLAAMAPGRLQD